ncbi:MAG: three-Cys-motif partner protein TcmP [Bifidobacteriaceae bacterium]|jgi:three-Cys-motif partner protein|nr:three-Cys-motif partner protein TcmP [Bifidobacteriaceae bacterium]
MATGTSAGLLDEKHAQSMFKHAILRQYLPRFIAKTGSRSPRVLLVDGYAGTGDSGAGPGSAKLMLQAARDTGSLTQVDIYLVESNATNYKRLSETAALFRQNGIQVQDRKGRIEDELPPIIAGSKGAALFLFLDPCGALMPFDYVRDTLTGPRAAKFPPTEGFLNFSDGLVRRAAGQVLKHSSDQEGAARLDGVCGGPWWRDIAARLRPRDAAESFEAIAQAVANEYARRLASATSMDGIVVPVRKRIDHQPIYHLIFLTRHTEGLWSFADCLGAAWPEWVEAMAREPDRSQPDLFNGAGVTLEGATLRAQLKRDALRQQAESAAAVEANIRRIAATGQKFRLVDHVAEVFADVLGIAREKQARSAVAALLKRGEIRLVRADKRLQRRLYSR